MPICTFNPLERYKKDLAAYSRLSVILRECKITFFSFLRDFPPFLRILEVLTSFKKSLDFKNITDRSGSPLNTIENLEKFVKLSRLIKVLES